MDSTTYQSTVPFFNSLFPTMHRTIQRALHCFMYNNGDHMPKFDSSASRIIVQS